MRDSASNPSDRAPQGRVAIIGAGISGLACASELARQSFSVSVIEKSRGAGGRTSTRRVDILGDREDFDHGAQYFTVRDPELIRFIEDWRTRGLVEEWVGRIVSVDGEAVKESTGRTKRWVGVPTMSAVCRHLAADLDVHYGQRVESIRKTSDGWELVDQDAKTLGRFDVVISTAPAPQTSTLLGPAAPELARRAASVQMQPCWALMVAFDARLDIPFDGAFVNEGPLSWVARTSSKPGRGARTDRWVIHGSSGWSTRHLEDPPAKAGRLLLRAFFAIAQLPETPPIYSQAHRWRHAIATDPLQDGFLFDATRGIGACGDWAHGNRIEGAFLSGLRAARAVAGAFDGSPQC